MFKDIVTNGIFYVGLLRMLLANYWRKLGYFLLQHMVTLVFFT